MALNKLKLDLNEWERAFLKTGLYLRAQTHAKKKKTAHYVHPIILSAFNLENGHEVVKGEVMAGWMITNEVAWRGRKSRDLGSPPPDLDRVEALEKKLKETLDQWSSLSN